MWVPSKKNVLYTLKATLENRIQKNIEMLDYFSKSGMNDLCNSYRKQIDVDIEKLVKTMEEIYDSNTNT